ncbi:MAG: glutamate 5-kinase [Oscillospiraceae bacterium]|nr:glutamate 5-kinase [Oscillospiraceae bacterium]
MCRRLFSFKNVKKLVVKVGTSSIAYPTGHINLRRIEKLVKVISDIKNSGIDIVLVSSGAIGVGCGKLKINRADCDTSAKQAAAAVGQCELMYMYDKIFSSYNHIVAQVLLTHDVIDNPDRKEKAIDTFRRLFELGAIPIVNENDTVSLEEIEATFGENDTLSAIVATLVGADALVIMSDIDGLYDSDPRKNPCAKLISEVRSIDPSIISSAGEAGSESGTGGMKTKLNAAKIVMDANIGMAILNCSDPAILYDLLDGKDVGTRFFK